jgi:hypothetical protein
MTRSARKILNCILFVFVCLLFGLVLALSCRHVRSLSMSLLTIIANMDELREIRLSLTRIAEALELISPPLLAVSSTSGYGAETPSEADRASRQTEPQTEPLFAESPEQYEERMDQLVSLAAQLNVAPGSPAFHRAIAEMRSDLLQPRIERDEETGEESVEQFTEEQADQVIRDAFREAKADANKQRIKV